MQSKCVLDVNVCSICVNELELPIRGIEIRLSRCVFSGRDSCGKGEGTERR